VIVKELCGPIAIVHRPPGYGSFSAVSKSTTWPAAMSAMLCRSHWLTRDPASFPSETGVDIAVPKRHRMRMEHVMEEPRKRITARVSENVRATLEQAAELLGATVNQFVVQTAYQEAQRLLERESVIRLSQKDARRVLSLLDSPPKPCKALKDAVKAFKGSVRA